MTDQFDARPGFYVGTEEDPDQYRLEEPAGGGGEGAVWKATSPRRDGGRYWWAVKVLHADNLDAGHEESAADALERWYVRAHDALHVTGQLQREVPGVVGATEVFRGPRPHPPGAAGEVRTLYVVSPWIDGTDLTKWLKHDPTFERVCAVVSRLAAIVDGIAASRAEVAHRDISPANVLVDAQTDAVSLIDFTFAVPTRSGPVTAINKRGYTAPEALVGKGSPGADRYSFGGVVLFLLTGHNPALGDAAAKSFGQLVRANFPAALAQHVSALLSADPADRPASLVSWAAEFAELGMHAPTGLRYADLDVTVDGFRTTTVTALGGAVLARARLGPGALRALVPDAGAPTAPVVVRSVTDGMGNTVDFVVTKAERLLLGRSGTWRDAGRAAVSAGLAVVRTATGSATAYVVDPVRDRMYTVDVAVDGTIQCGAAGPHLRHVLAATTDHDGIAVVAATSPEGELMMISGDDMERLGPTEVRSAAIGLNTFGEPVCFVATADGDELMTFEQRYGQWLPTGGVQVPCGVSEVACVGQRDGVTLAVAGADGLWIGTHAGPWQRLSDRHCHRVALAVGAAWRIQLAAVADGEVIVATEDFTGQWSTTAITQ